MPRSFLVKRNGCMRSAEEQNLEEAQVAEDGRNSSQYLEYAITLLALSKNKQWKWDYELEKSYWFDTKPNQSFTALLFDDDENNYKKESVTTTHTNVEVTTTDSDILSSVHALTTLMDSSKTKVTQEFTKTEANVTPDIAENASKFENLLAASVENTETNCSDTSSENSSNIETDLPNDEFDQKMADMLSENEDVVNRDIVQFLANNCIALEEIVLQTDIRKEDIEAYMYTQGELSQENKRRLYKWYLQKIIRRSQENGEGSYTCSKCGKIFTYKSYLERHIKYVCPDSTGRTWKCSFCGKAFQYPCYLRRHVRSHTGESPYKCDKCDRAFVRSTDLQRHIRNHTGEKPYSCSQCSRAFARSTDLKRHMRTHTGEKPYKCWKCGKSFSQSGSLQTHLHTHNKDTSSQNPRPVKKRAHGC